MPIVAVGAAVLSVSAVGAAGFGAVLAGTASLATTFAAIGAVGATLGAIGEVAGIDELKTAGMVIGGIGGVGSLASAVGAFGEGATLNSVFGSGTTAGAAAGQDTASLINGGSWFDAESGMMLDSATGALQGSATSGFGDIISAANKIGGFSMPSNKTQELEGPNADPLSSGVKAPTRQQELTSNSKDTSSALAQQANADAPDETSPGLSSAAKGAAATGTPSGTNMTSKTGGASITGGVNGPPPNPKMGDVWTNPDTDAAYTFDGKNWTPKPGFWGSSMGQMLGMGVVQSAGSFLSGAFDEVKPAQAAAYNAQAEANNAQAALDRKQLSNMNEGIPVARRLGVTGRPGIINQGAAA